MIAFSLGFVMGQGCRTPEQKNSDRLLIRAIKKADTDKDGKIQRKEVAGLLKTLGCKDTVPGYDYRFHWTKDKIRIEYGCAFGHKIMLNVAGLRKYVGEKR